MTSINAMRFDSFSGMCVCDEARSWNDEYGKLLTAEKMRLITSDEVMKNTGAIAVLGKTGSSTLGNEYLEKLKDRITVEYDRKSAKEGIPIKEFMTIRAMAHLLFHTLCDIKREHLDHTLRARYGFTQDDFIAGFYLNDEGCRVEIKDSSVIEEVNKMITWEGSHKDSTPIFLNGQIVMGYEPEEGFKIFRSNLMAAHCEAVHEIFACDGSGIDSTDFVYTDFANSRNLQERRGTIDRVEGLAVLLEALDTANHHSAGCNGYPKVIYIDGRQKDLRKKYIEIHDCRSQLALEIVRASNHGFIPGVKCLTLIEGLIFENESFIETDDQMKRASNNPVAMLDMLRGHKHY